MKRSVEDIVHYMGFPDTETGPYVTALRQKVRKQVAAGMTYRSGGSWGPEGEKLSYEGRARELLAMDWEIEHGHSYRIEAIDGLRSWHSVSPWLGDLLRKMAMRLRMWHNRKLVNPYKK